jgi:hypothetical protein
MLRGYFYIDFETHVYLPPSHFVCQVCCTAQSLFAGLEKKRAGYFNNITDAELEEIPTLLLLHLP